METFKCEDSIVEYDIDDLVIMRGQAEWLLAGIMHPDVYNENEEAILGMGGLVASRIKTKKDGNFVELQSIMKDEIFDRFASDKEGRIELIEFVIREALAN